MNASFGLQKTPVGTNYFSVPFLFALTFKKYNTCSQLNSKHVSCFYRVDKKSDYELEISIA